MAKYNPMSHVKTSALDSTSQKGANQYVSEKIKLDDKIVKDHISDWSYETKDDLGNKVIKQKRD